MNNVCLVGNICRDVELKYTSGNDAKAIVRNSIAVPRTYKNKETGKYDADFIEFVCFGKTAEFIGKNFSKGQKIGITGKIQTGSYTNKEGKKVFTTVVAVDAAEFVGAKGQDNNATPTPSNADFINQGIDESGLTTDLPWE